MTDLTLPRMILNHPLPLATVIAFLLGIAFQFLPIYWQLIIIAGFAAGLVCMGWFRGFLAGFLGVLLSWGVYVTYHWFVFPASQVFSTLGDIVGVSGLLLIAIGVLVASFFSGLGALIAVAVRRLVQRQ